MASNRRRMAHAPPREPLPRESPILRSSRDAVCVRHRERSRGSDAAVARSRGGARANIDRGDRARLARGLPRYDATSTWTRIPPRVDSGPAQQCRGPMQRCSTRSRRNSSSSSRAAGPGAEGIRRALGGALRARRGDTHVWSIVARPRDYATLDARAFEFARDAAQRDAEERARAAARRLAPQVASENVTTTSDDPGAAERRCALGTRRTPERRPHVAALTETSAGVSSTARVAIAFGSERFGRALHAARATGAAPRSRNLAATGESAPTLYGATNAATRLRLDVARIGPVIAVFGTSARLRPATIMRYD